MENRLKKWINMSTQEAWQRKLARSTTKEIK
jgi:hypothetical protein